MELKYFPSFESVLDHCKRKFLLKNNKTEIIFVFYLNHFNEFILSQKILPTTAEKFAVKTRNFQELFNKSSFEKSGKSS